ncbi:MAG: hypothetical protein ACI9CZ_000369, partial [Flavobacterium sp.]
RNENKLKEAGTIRFKSRVAVDEQWVKKGYDQNSVQYTYESDRNKKSLESDKNNYNVHGKDADGNEVFGSINIEGEVGIGIISGAEAKVIEIIAERTGQNLLIATDVKGSEYKLKLDRN